MFANHSSEGYCGWRHCKPLTLFRPYAESPIHD